jgi:hypothetical protein
VREKAKCCFSLYILLFFSRTYCRQTARYKKEQILNFMNAAEQRAVAEAKIRKQTKEAQLQNETEIKQQTKI